MEINPSYFYLLLFLFFVFLNILEIINKINRVIKARASLIKYFCVVFSDINLNILVKSFLAIKLIDFSSFLPSYTSSVPTVSPFFTGKL